MANRPAPALGLREGDTEELVRLTRSSSVRAGLAQRPVDGPRMERNVRLDAERTGTTPDLTQAGLVSRAALGRMLVEDEVGEALVALLRMPALTAADIDLSAGMAAR